jgi:hypothetical protein
MTTTTERRSGVSSRMMIVGLLAGIAGCFPAQPPPPPAKPAYQPNFGYKTGSQEKKLEVTIGIIEPQFTAATAVYHQSQRNDEMHKLLLSSMGASFNEILLAKGFNTKGPFVSLNDMTFPEKKGSDLLLYPEFDFQIQITASNFRADSSSSGGGGGVLGALSALGGSSSKKKRGDGNTGEPDNRVGVCDIDLTIDGNLLFVAQEPLSGERMWIKRLDVTKGKETIQGQRGPVCNGGAMTPDVRDAWAKAHEAVYQSSMKSLDNYVNGEEFQMLKHQSLELRAKKAY